MPNPYHGRPPYTFWRQGVVEQAESGVDPVVSAPFTISRQNAVATAGSCFAQHISRTLVHTGFRYLVTETFSPCAGISDENFAVFPARFGNVYTARQLLQLFDRAYERFQPKVDFWLGSNGAVLDPFRPRVQAAGFGSVVNLHNDRPKHLAAVRAMFEQCDVFVFTLGLTEAWISTIDGSVFPLSPGVLSPEIPDAEYEFRNFTVAEVSADMIAFLDRLSGVNPSCRIILTVSPVPLIATYEDRHVLVSTVASKSILRAAVEEIISCRPAVTYFPSYEIITGPQARGRYYADDLREVTSDGVAYVMSLFSRHYLNTMEILDNVVDQDLDPEDYKRMAALASIICDEEAISR
jgi:hypothetical protein